VTKPNLALIGFSTTGKSTVARLLAQTLGWYSADTDQMIVATAGRPIHAIFSAEGEAAFRARETAVLVAALAGSRTVIATGGGIMTIAANREWLRQRARLVCLTATPETILARLQVVGRTEPRPMLDAPDPLARIRTLLAQRQAVYAEADVTIPTDDRTPEQVAAEILRWCEAED
jgi:shikimate kinase